MAEEALKGELGEGLGREGSEAGAGTGGEQATASSTATVTRT